MYFNLRQFINDGEWPLIFRIKGGVVFEIWPQVLGGILFSILIVCLHNYVPALHMNFPLTLVSILGIVIGLLLVFRTNTAYDRYWEGRKIWSNMTHHIRVLTRCTWLGIKETNEPETLIEKITAINILVAFSYATKNYLREEYSYDSDEEIRELLDHIPKFQTPSSNISLDKQMTQKEEYCIDNGAIPSDSDNGKKRSVKIEIPETEGISNKEERPKSKKLKGRITMSMRRRFAQASNQTDKRRDSSSMFKAHDYVTPSNIPLELAYCFSSYIYSIMSREMVDGTTTFVLMGSLNQLMDSLTQFERILRTPIPLAYSVHLHQSIWLYLFSLPFQLVGTLGWFTAPAMGVACFALLGILAIGWEIENPFGYDDNDLPLDDFCDVINQEVQRITGHKFPDPSEWIFSQKNHPFAPASNLSAIELKQKTMDELLEILDRRQSLINASTVNYAFQH